jgi:hypothetical protein
MEIFKEKLAGRKVERCEDLILKSLAHHRLNLKQIQSQLSAQQHPALTMKRGAFLSFPCS